MLSYNELPRYTAGSDLIVVLVLPTVARCDDQVERLDN